MLIFEPILNKLRVFKFTEICNLRFAQRVSKQAVGEFRLKQQPQQAHQSSWQVYQGPKQLIVRYLERYQVRVVSKGP